VSFCIDTCNVTRDDLLFGHDDVFRKYCQFATPIPGQECTAMGGPIVDKNPSPPTPVPSYDLNRSVYNFDDILVTDKTLIYEQFVIRNLR